MTRFITLLCLCLATLAADASLAQMKKEARVALVVVNSDYDETPLKSALQDGKKMRDFLQKQHFEVIYAENVDKRHFVKLIRDFSASMSADGIALFYYNGHAVQHKGENLLIPIESAIETDKHLLRQSIAVETLASVMQKAGNRLSILIIDAAYANPFGTIYTPDKAGLAAFKAQERMLYILSRAPDTVATSSSFCDSFVTYFSQSAHDLKSGIEEVEAFSSGKEKPWITGDGKERFFFALPQSLGAAE